MPAEPPVTPQALSGSADEQARALFFQGLECSRNGDEEGAAASYRASLALAPNSAAAHGNLALVHDRAGRVAQAEHHYRVALALDPNGVQTLINFGVMLVRLKRLVEGDRCYQQALRLEPGSAAALTNLGVLMAIVKQEAAAEQLFRRVLEQNPEHRLAHFNLAYPLLRQGRFAEGWAALEARDWYRSFAARIACPCWQGESLDGRALLLVTEAGHGDMIQFCRYVPLLRALGASRITILVQPALVRLMAALEGIGEVLPLEADLGGARWDYWTMPLSLPFRFDTRIDSIPASLPYLHASSAAVAAADALLPPAQGRLRVGLVWRGNARFENDSERSLPGLAVLEPLLRLDGVQWISLQKGSQEAYADSLPAGVTMFAAGPLLGDFADTAGVLMHLDLVVSVDTAVAHLAGALGRPCWLLLSEYLTDWRWMTGRSDSPWYPGVMRLFRQTRPGDWSQVIAAVRTALQEELETRVRSPGADRRPPYPGRPDSPSGT